jgi:site-specific recombinase XerD
MLRDHRSFAVEDLVVDTELLENASGAGYATKIIFIILKAIDRTTPQGTRDYALLATMFNTGARVQEIADLRACDHQLAKPFQVRLFGKGGKSATVRCARRPPQSCVFFRRSGT